MACQAGDVAKEMKTEDLALLLTKRGGGSWFFAGFQWFKRPVAHNVEDLCSTGLALAEMGELEEALKDHEQARSLAEDNNFLQSSLGADILVNMGIAKAWCHETRCLPYLVSL